MKSLKKNELGPQLTWRQVAVGAVILAAGSVAALIVVGSIDNVDALATIALALAIVTFVTQIIVFVAQTWTTAQLNAETRGFLQELQTSAHGTERALNTQVDKLTDHLLNSFQAARKKEDGAGSPDFRRRVREDVAQALEAAGPVTLADPREEPPASASAPSQEDQRILQELATVPPEEIGVPLMEALDGLSPIAVGNLRVFAEDERDSREAGIAPGLALLEEHPFSDEAREAGFLEFLGEDDGMWARLTDKGRQVARILLARGDFPAWMKPS